MIDSMKVNYPDVHKSEWSWAGWDFDIELTTPTLEHLKHRQLVNP